MFYKVQSGIPGAKCKIDGFGHTAIADDPLRFKEVDQVTFIKYIMSAEGRYELFGGSDPSEEDILAMARKWEAQTSIQRRVFFSGTTQELATIAAQKCLAQAKVEPRELDAIIGGTNTGPYYPSLADFTKLALGQESSAMAYDVTEACTTGTIAVFHAWDLIHSGVCKKVLVVLAERATILTAYDNWQGSNLFGDGAFAYLLSANEAEEAFIFFDFHSMPFDGLIDKITKTENGFRQEGKAVHRFVGSSVVEALVAAVAKAGIDPKDIDHLVPHQPSGKTLDLLEEKLRRHWPGFRGKIHRQVEFTGNTSSASTGSIISAAVHSGLMKKGQVAVVTSFGAGLSIGNLALII